MLIRSAEQDIERVLYTEKAIAARVEEIGTELTKKLGDKRPVLVCVLKGASFFYIDLCRCMNCPIDVEKRRALEHADEHGPLVAILGGQLAGELFHARGDGLFGEKDAFNILFRRSDEHKGPPA